MATVGCATLEKSGDNCRLVARVKALSAESRHPFLDRFFAAVNTLSTVDLAPWHAAALSLNRRIAP